MISSQYKLLFVFCHFLIACFNLKAQKIEWIKQIKGSSAEISSQIVADASGNTYTAGEFRGTVDFDPGPGVFNISATQSDIFLLKLDPNGKFLWVKQFKGTNNSYVNSIVLDKSGFVYLAGIFYETVDFDPGLGSYTLSSAGEQDAFYVKLDTSGNFNWAHQIGAAKTDQAKEITIDRAGNMYVTGRFTDTVDFNPDTAVNNLTSRTFWNMFVLKLSALGKFVWVRQFDNCFEDNCIIDSLGNVYTAGSFYNTVDFDPGNATYNITSNGYKDVFILKLDSFGNFVWVKCLGGLGEDVAFVIRADATGNLYIVGAFDETMDFDPSAGVFNLKSFGSWDMFVLKLKASGDFTWAKQMGGKFTDRANAMHVDPNGNIYITGEFQKTADLDPGTGVFIVNTYKSENLYDEFVLKLGATGNFLWAKKISGASEEEANAIYSDASGTVYLAGYFEGTVNFDSTAGNIINLVSSGNNDGFICKLGNKTSDINDINQEIKGYSVYPMPNHGLFSLVFSGHLTGIYIEVYNSLGDMIYSESDIKEINAINLQNQVNGLYVLRILDSSGRIHTENIVKY